MTPTKNGVLHYVDAQKLKADLDINPIDLSTAMMRQAGLFAHYAALHANAEHQFAKKEQLLEIIESKIDKEIREAASGAGQKITEAAIEKQVRSDPRYIRAKSALNEARMVATLAKSCPEAFRHRKDMLVQHAVNEREEKKGELRVSDPAQQARNDHRRDLAGSLRQGGND